MYNLRKTKSRDASMRSRSNSPMNVDDPKIKPKLEWEDLISEHESESGNYSQSDIQKSYKIEEQKKLESSGESSSESSGSDIHGEGDYSGSDVQSDQDSDHIQELRDASNFSEKEIRSLLKSFFEANLSEAEVCSKKIKGLSRTTIYRVFKKLRETGTISRKPGSGRKSKIQDDIFDKVKAILKDDNTLSAGEIQQKLEEQGIRVSNSSITRALKSRKYNYKKPNVETMLLNDVQKKARKEFCQNYIDSDYSKMIFTDECVFKGGKQRSRKWCSDQESYKVSSMKPKWKVNVWGGIWLNGKIS